MNLLRTAGTTIPGVSKGKPERWGPCVPPIISAKCLQTPPAIHLLPFSLAEPVCPQLLQTGSQHASGAVGAQLRARQRGCVSKKPANLLHEPPRAPTNSRSCTWDRCWKSRFEAKGAGHEPAPRSARENNRPNPMQPNVGGF